MGSGMVGASADLGSCSRLSAASTPNQVAASGKESVAGWKMGVDMVRIYCIIYIAVSYICIFQKI